MKIPETVRNRVSYAGILIAVLSFIVFVFLFIFNSVSGARHVPYASLVIFILVPGVLLIGLILIPIGMLFSWLQWKRTGEIKSPSLPIIDLNKSSHWNAMIVFLAGSVIVLFVAVYSGYRAYQYTESVVFCGTLCHQVMEPQYTAYQHSPHAEVSCADCHIGPGASWYVRSKLSGLYQVYATVRDIYPRPIPGTIDDLRPSRVVCEQCHWPEAFLGGKQARKTYFLSDKTNTRHDLNLLLKVGGGRQQRAKSRGIHWHMDINNKIEYIAPDPNRQNIVWVRFTDLTSGDETIYEVSDSKLNQNQVDNADIRVMDCMDCHNRPSHLFHAPDEAINKALASRQISPEIPFIKEKGVEVLSATYQFNRQAMTQIEKKIVDYYEQSSPKLTRDQEDLITKATSAIQQIYRENFFPDMKVRWTVYPSNIGHMIFPGCKRCHDGLHESAGGRIVPADCDSCHIILSQGTEGNISYLEDENGLEFKHPVPIGGMWRQLNCTECHAGGAQEGG